MPNLKCTWTQESALDLMAFYNIDTEKEMVDMLVREFWSDKAIIIEYLSGKHKKHIKRYIEV